MAYCEKRTITLTLSGGATSGTAYSPVVNGRIVSIRYIPAASGTKLEGASGNFDLTIKSETTQGNIWVETGITAAKTVYPSRLAQDTAGADTTIRDVIQVADERISFAVANADADSSGSWELTIEGTFKGV